MEDPARNALAELESLPLAVFFLVSLTIGATNVGWDYVVALSSMGTSVLVYVKCTKVQKLIAGIERSNNN